MSSALTSCEYQRRDVVWRNLADEVLVLCPPPSSRVLVLGGGSAVVWRHLKAPASPEQLARVVGGGITAEEVEEALELIVSAGLAQKRGHHE